MEVALIGATGFVGAAILEELLERGHVVTAIARNMTDVPQRRNLVFKAVDVLDRSTLTEAVRGHDVVISAYNAGWTNPNLYDDFLEGSVAIQESVKDAGVKRLFVNGGAGSLFVADGVQKVDTPSFPSEWKAGALAARDYLNILRNEESLEWTFLSPALEMHKGTSGERRAEYRTGLDTPVYDEEGRSIISVEDLAVAVVDEIEDPKHIRRRFTIGY